MNNIDKIYVVHYTPLVDRKQYLINQFEKYNITNYEFYEEYNRDNVTKETLDSYYKLGRLTPAQICITIAHIELYRKIIENNYKTVLILEDDARLVPNFNDLLNIYLEAVPSDFDMLFLNDGCDLHASPIISGTLWYPQQSTRTCCAYIITKPTCEKLLSTIIPFEKAIDHELNKQIVLHNLHVYWCEPTIVSDGSGRLYGSSYKYY